MRHKLIARKSTIEAAIKVSREKLAKGYYRGMDFYTLPDRLRDEVDSTLGSVRRDVEPAVLDKLIQLQNNR